MDAESTSTASPRLLNECDELLDHDRRNPLSAVKDRLRGCSAKNLRGGSEAFDLSNEDYCPWDVVNLGLEKTGTSEVANLLRLLNVSDMKFASPRGAGTGLKVLERCGCDPRVRFVLTARQLLDMVVSRMAYHHWTCEEDASNSSAPGTSITRHTRCGGLDSACCWRQDPTDMIQSWVLCRDEYHVRVAELLAAAQATDRLLVVNLLKEGEHRVFARLKHFIVEHQPPSAYVTPTGGEEAAAAAVAAEKVASDPIEAAKHRGRRGGRASKLLRRHTNRQSYPDGLKPCLRSWAEGVALEPPLELRPGSLNEPLVSQQISRFSDLDTLAALQRLLQLGTSAWKGLNAVQDTASPSNFHQSPLPVSGGGVLDGGLHQVMSS